MTAEDTVAHRFEHSLEVQLPFLQSCAPRSRIVPICISRMPLEMLLQMGVRAEQQALAKHGLNYVLEEYLPQQMDPSEIEPIVRACAEELNVSSPKDMGPLMKAVMAKTAGAADGAVVSGIVKAVIAERSE